MTTKPKAKKFRIRRTKTGAAQKPVEQETVSATEQAQPAEKTTVDIQKDIDAIRREGIIGRQLRVARRLAQKKGMAVTSDFDAVRQLREAGLDPFEREALLELVQPDGSTASQKAPSQQLPQTVPAAGQNLPSTQTLSPSERRNVEITTIQKQIAARRRKKLALLFTRLACFVLLPTALVGWYFFTVATPMYSTKSEFVIQTADSGAGAGGLGGLFQGTSIANQQDSITVQSYLTSRAAMLRLEEEHGFKQHFSQDSIDAIQRLPAEA